MTDTRINDKPAIDGGPPVIEREMNRYKGAAVIGDEEKAAVMEVLDSQSLFRYYGPDLRSKVATFEQGFAAYVGSKHGAASTSGTAALRLGLAGLGVGPGDEVIVPAVTFIASVGAIVANRARPVFAEIDATMQLDPADLERCLSPRTKAIMPVHLDGVAVDMDAVIAFSRANELVVTGLTALTNLEHRGATGAEPDSGDGAGILLQVPDRFFQEVTEFDLQLDIVTDDS